MLLLLLGFVCAECCARALKHALQQPRPSASCALLGTCHSWGMPSSHTLCMAFALAARISLLLRMRADKSTRTLALGCVEAVGLALGVAGVAVSRVYLGYHSTGQVAAAVVLGLAGGGVWVGLVMRGLSTAFPALAASGLGRHAGLRDTWGQADALQAECRPSHLTGGRRACRGAEAGGTHKHSRRWQG